MKILPRTKFGNPILRERARPVKLSLIGTKKFQTLVRMMFYTMRRVDGVGLAAPQIGQSLQLAVIGLHPTKGHPELTDPLNIVLINPKILSRGKKQETDWEGCLSLPGVRGAVPRYDRLKVRYMNEEGKTVTAEVGGFLARVFQHEIDHLNGALYVDRMKDMKTLSTEEEYTKRHRRPLR